MLGQQICGALSLTTVFLVPLAVLLVIRAIAGELEPRKLIGILAALLIAEFLISIEVFATMTAIGGMGLLLGGRSRLPTPASALCEYFRRLLWRTQQ